MATESNHAVGELLKQGRLRQRLSIAECAKRTHIAVRYLEALEEERWEILPSESHRLGFLRLYSRFLGVSADDVLALYRQKTAPPRVEKPGTPVEVKERRDTSRHLRTPAPAATWSPSTVPQIIGLGALLMVLAWVVYHAVSPRLLEQNQIPWIQRRSPSQSRLVVPKAMARIQKVRVKASADSWMRVMSKNELLYEGILPGGSVKEWSGTGPFQVKVGNYKAVSLFWNDQPVDVSAGAVGNVNLIRIPPQ
jgi:transcriptional regulator with XRE-family HTH domain